MCRPALPASFWQDVLALVDSTSPYALTGAVFARDRSVLVTAGDALKHACGNLYFNDKCTGAVVGEQVPVCRASHCVLSARALAR